MNLEGQMGLQRKTGDADAKNDEWEKDEAIGIQ
jgi:hypothetical protein